MVSGCFIFASRRKRGQMNIRTYVLCFELSHPVLSTKHPPVSPASGEKERQAMAPDGTQGNSYLRAHGTIWAPLRLARLSDGLWPVKGIQCICGLWACELTAGWWGWDRHRPRSICTLHTEEPVIAEHPATWKGGVRGLAPSISLSLPSIYSQLTARLREP